MERLRALIKFLFRKEKKRRLKEYEEAMLFLDKMGTSRRLGADLLTLSQRIGRTIEEYR